MVKQDVLLDLLPEGGWIDLHKPRLTPLKNEELTLYQRFLLFLMLKVGKARCPNIFRTMFRNLRVYFPFARFNATVMPKGELSRRHTELAILRVAWKIRSFYEWGQHVEIGMRVGITPEEIVRITQGADAQGWDKREQVIIQTVDELLHDKTLSEITWSRLSEYFEKKLILELLFVITTYNSLACILNSVGVELESDVYKVLAETGFSR